MACVKKYYAPNGQESILFNQLVEQYGEWRAEEIYLKLNSENFNELFQKEVEIPKTIPDTELVKSLSWISNNTPFLRDIELSGGLNQYAQYLKTIFPNSTFPIIWSEPSDRRDKSGSLKSDIESANNKTNQTDINYYVYSKGLPKNLRDAAPYVIDVQNPYITKKGASNVSSIFQQEQTAWETSNYRESFIDHLRFEQDYDSIVRIDNNDVSTISLFQNSEKSLRLGSPQDVANFKEWLRNNPDSKSTIKIKEKKFDFKGSVYDINGEPRFDIVTSADVLSKINNVKFQKLSASDIANNLVSSAQGKIQDASGDTYSVLGKSLSRVSTVLNRPEWVPYQGKSAGIKYEDKGIRYHSVLQYLVEGKSLTELNIADSEISFVNGLTALVNRLKSEGGQLISELKIASLDADGGNGIAGTIDLVHIKPNGKADVYDLKTAYNTERVVESGKSIWDISHDNSYKAKRYTAQTMIYAKMLEDGDTQLGRVPVPIDNIFVIPVEVSLDTKNDNIVQTVNYDNPQNIRQHKDWKKDNKFFYDTFRKKISNLFSSTEDNSESKLKAEFENRGVEGFLKSAFQVEELNEADMITKRAIHFVERYPLTQNEFTISGDNTRYKFESSTKEGRVQQIKKIFANQNQNFGILATTDAIEFFNKIYLGKDEKTNIPNFDPSGDSGRMSQRRAARLSKIFEGCNAQKVEVVTGYPNVLLIHRGDGGYDLLNILNRDLEDEIEIKNKSKLYNRLGVNQSYNTLFGNYITPIQAKGRGVTLSNNYGDFSRLKLAIIGMQLAKENPDIKVNRLLVDYAYSNSEVFARGTTMNDMVSQVKLMHNIDEIKQMEPDAIKTILDDNSLYVKGKYNEDPLTELADYIEQNLSSRKYNTDIIDNIERFRKRQITSEQLADELLKGSKGILNEIRIKYNLSSGQEQKDKISQDPTFQALSRAYATLKGYGLNPESDMSDGFAGGIAKWITSPTLTGRPLLDKFNNEIRFHYNNVKSKLTSFLQEKAPIIDGLIESQPLFKSGVKIGEKRITQDNLFGMARTVFEKLIVKKTDGKGNTYFTPYLIPENSSEFNALTKQEQIFIKFFNDKVQEMDPSFKRGQIPIMQTGSDTYLTRAKQSLSNADLRTAASNTKLSVQSMWNMVTSKGNFKSEAERNTIVEFQARDRFSHQSNDGEFSTSSLENIGLDSLMNLTDSNKNANFETNLEDVLTQFMRTKIHVQEMDKALPKYYMFRSIFKYLELSFGSISEKGSSLEDSIKMMDNYVNDLALNIKQGEDKILSKWVNVSIRLASLSLIAFKPKVWVGNTAQMTISGSMEAMLNTVVKDNRFPWFPDYVKATKILAESKVNMLLAKKIRLMRQLYIPEDVNILSGIRYQGVAKGMATEQTVYAIDRALDVGYREHFMVAQMIKDGTWDAHSIESEIDKYGNRIDKVVYDKSKDSRFTGQDGEALYKAIKKSMVDRGEITDSEEIKMAYDWHLRERMKAYISRNIGTYDRDLGSDLARHSLMQGFNQFRSWFRDKFWRSTISQYDPEIFGDMKKAEDGQYYWSPEPMKGMLRSLADLHMFGDIVQAYRKGELSKEDQKNYVLAATSLTTFALLSLLTAALFADDDDEEFNVLKISTMAAADELLNSFTLSPIVNILVSPLVFASYYQNLFKSTIKVMGYGLEGDWEKGYNNFIDFVPIITQLPEEVTKIEED